MTEREMLVVDQLLKAVEGQSKEVRAFAYERYCEFYRNGLLTSQQMKAITDAFNA